MKMGHSEYVIFVLAIFFAVVSADLETNLAVESIPLEIQPRQENAQNILKGLRDRLNTGAQNVINGIEKFVGGVLGAQEHLSNQIGIGEAAEATPTTESQTTIADYEEETTPKQATKRRRTTKTPFKRRPITSRVQTTEIIESTLEPEPVTVIRQNEAKTESQNTNQILSLPHFPVGQISIIQPLQPGQPGYQPGVPHYQIIIPAYQTLPGQQQPAIINPDITLQLPAINSILSQQQPAAINIVSEQQQPSTNSVRQQQQQPAIINSQSAITHQQPAIINPVINQLHPIYQPVPPNLNQNINLPENAGLSLKSSEAQEQPLIPEQPATAAAPTLQPNVPSKPEAVPAPPQTPVAPVVVPLQPKTPEGLPVLPLQPLQSQIPVAGGVISLQPKFSVAPAAVLLQPTIPVAPAVIQPQPQTPVAPAVVPLQPQLPVTPSVSLLQPVFPEKSAIAALQQLVAALQSIPAESLTLPNGNQGTTVPKTTRPPISKLEKYTLPRRPLRTPRPHGVIKRPFKENVAPVKPVRPIEIRNPYPVPLQPFGPRPGENEVAPPGEITDELSTTVEPDEITEEATTEEAEESENVEPDFSDLARDNNHAKKINRL